MVEHPTTSGKHIRTIAVHAMGDERVHLAPARLGHLKLGRLKTLCGRLAVTALSPFAAAEPNRCRTCFGKVDEQGYASLDSPAAKAPAPKKRPAPARSK
jgi:hypothetical protein